MSQVKPCLEKLNQDQDIDVKFFSAEALESNFFDFIFFLKKILNNLYFFFLKSRGHPSNVKKNRKKRLNFCKFQESKEKSEEIF